ncbi:hypothetical protein GCM10027072_58350 [Streptomyces bullii]
MSRFQAEIRTVKLVANLSNMVTLRTRLATTLTRDRPGSLPEGSREPDRWAQPQLHIDNRTPTAQPQPNNNRIATVRYG